ncbi:MAG: mitochondrial import inner membrane translocase subunit tim54 [Caeruleum heppii]|nr:MAG: mitochondrial import inner membrane translocase subunit tim54 [Caeruleum heppii]
MADSKPSTQEVPPVSSSKPPAPPERNPAFRMMGMPNISLKLPSRNWLIFLSFTGTITSLILYDRYEKRKAQRKWCTLVSHIAQQPLDSRAMPRKLTIFLSAPPGDGLRTSRDHFVEYIKPVLVAGAMDWEVIEGRREGEVRAGLAEKIRKLRKKQGEKAEMAAGEEAEADENIVGDIRKNTGVKEWDGVGGDIVIGRHTWREYVRGLHEGWLGPLTPPPDPTSEILTLPSESTDPSSPSLNTLPSESPAQTPTDDNSPTAPPPTPEPSKPTKSSTPAPFISTTAYSSAPLPPSFPVSFDPSTPLPQPHILGFLNTPIRIYRFLTRRRLADAIGRETAALVLGAYDRPYNTSSSPNTTPPDSSSELAPDITTNDSSTSTGKTSASEQTSLLEAEEADWHKSVRKRTPDDAGERVWLDEMVLDERVAGRMRRFVLGEEEERRAERIGRGEEAELGKDEREQGGV